MFNATRNKAKRNKSGSANVQRGVCAMSANAIDFLARCWPMVCVLATLFATAQVLASTKLQSFAGSWRFDNVSCSILFSIVVLVGRRLCRCRCHCRCLCCYYWSFEGDKAIKYNIIYIDVHHENVWDIQAVFTAKVSLNASEKICKRLEHSSSLCGV